MRSNMKEQRQQSFICPITGLPLIEVLISIVAVFLAISVYEWVLYDMFLKPAYKPAPPLWRPIEEDMRFHRPLIYTAFLAFLISIFHSWGRSIGGQGWIFAIGSGLIFGLIICAVDFRSFLWQPTPMDIVIPRLAGDLIMGAPIGLVLGMLDYLYKKGGRANG